MASSQEARTAVARTQRLRRQLNQLMKETEQELRDLSTYQNATLSPEGLAQRRAVLAAETRAGARREAARLQRVMDRSAKTITQYAERRRPKLPNDAAAQVRMGQAWDRVKMMLEADRTWHDVLQMADPEMAMALRTYGPAWFNSRPATDWKPADLQAFNNTVDHHLGQMLGGHAQTAVEYSRELAGTKAWWDQTVAHFDLATSGEPQFDLVKANDQLYRSALLARFDEQAAGALWPEPSAEPSAEARPRQLFAATDQPARDTDPRDHGRPADSPAPEPADF